MADITPVSGPTEDSFAPWLERYEAGENWSDLLREAVGEIERLRDQYQAHVRALVSEKGDMRYEIERHSKFEKMLVESHRELADRHIRDLGEKIAAAERGEYDGNVAVMRDLLDKWLEHRHAHGDDERLPL
jgi:hypothetical protein